MLRVSSTGLPLLHDSKLLAKFPIDTYLIKSKLVSDNINGAKIVAEIGITGQYIITAPSSEIATSPGHRQAIGNFFVPIGPVHPQPKRVVSKSLHVITPRPETFTDVLPSFQSQLRCGVRDRERKSLVIARPLMRKRTYKIPSASCCGELDAENR